MVTIKTNIKNDKVLYKNIGVLSQLVNNWRPALQKVSEQIKVEEGKVFDSQGSYNGRAPWAALSPKYSLRKTRMFPGKSILRATDKLYNSVKGGSGSFTIYTDRSVEQGTTIPYAIYHQTGTSNMPQRMVYSTSAKQNKDVEKIINDYVVQVAKSKGVSIVQVSA